MIFQSDEGKWLFLFLQELIINPLLRTVELTKALKRCFCTFLDMDNSKSNISPVANQVRVSVHHSIWSTPEISSHKTPFTQSSTCSNRIWYKNGPASRKRASYWAPVPAGHQEPTAPDTDAWERGPFLCRDSAHWNVTKLQVECLREGKACASLATSHFNNICQGLPKGICQLSLKAS